jgi:hypothetical protein
VSWEVVCEVTWAVVSEADVEMACDGYREKRRQRDGESAVECFACGESGKIVRSDSLC